MGDSLERITNLLALLLSSHRGVTLADIRNDLADFYGGGSVETTRALFERDKRTLRSIGVPIESEVLGGTDAGRSRYSVDRRRFELADLDLEPDERAALELAVSAARLSNANLGLLKLGGMRGASMVFANIPDLPSLPALREATARSASVHFRYRDLDRVLHPYVLLLREGFWYVIGFDETRGERRTYRVDRIEGDVVVGEPGAFERPADFDIRTAFPSDARLLGDEPETVATVRIGAVRHGHERELGSVVDRRPDGSIVVEVPCANRDAFRSWLLGWGADAEVLGPPDVRADFIGWLRAMADRS